MNAEGRTYGTTHEGIIIDCRDAQWIRPEKPDPPDGDGADGDQT